MSTPESTDACADQLVADAIKAHAVAAGFNPNDSDDTDE